jgi:hypothetical protein
VSLRRLIPWLLILAIVVAPGTALVVLNLVVDDTPPELVVVPEPVILEPTVRVREERMDALLVFDAVPGPELASSGLPGLVTSVEVATGDELRSGDAVFSVDGQMVLAATTESPFFRELRSGSRGADVEALQRLLVDWGFLDAEPDGVFATSTAAAVRTLEIHIGVATPTSRFSPSYLIWLPKSPMHVGEVNVRTGFPAPASGEVIVQGLAEIVSARFVGSDGSPVRFDGARTVELDGHDLGATGSSEISEDVVRGALVGMSENDVTREEGMVSVPVVLRLPEPELVTVVASSAVMVDATGTAACVWVANSNAGYEAVEVHPVGGTLGVTEVDENLEGEGVLANPLEILADPSCP